MKENLMKNEGIKREKIKVAIILDASFASTPSTYFSSDLFLTQIDLSYSYTR